MESALAVFSADARRWLTVSQGLGADAVLDVYDQLVNGTVDPAEGHVLSV
jgi:hypothetical protein